jgi:hypothetical protein
VWHDGDEHRVMSPDTLTEKSTPDVAVDLLGIGEDDAAMLFHRDNTRPALARMVKDLVNGEELRRFEDYYKEAGEEGAS